jgi:hypothetical protein
VLTVPRGSCVLLLQDDHSSPVLEWIGRADAQRFTVEIVPRPDDGDWTAALVTAIERLGAPPVGMASISSVHWADGSTVDLDRIAVALKKHDARFVRRDPRRRCDAYRRAHATSPSAGRTARRSSKPPRSAARSVQNAHSTCAIRAMWRMHDATTWASSPASICFNGPKVVCEPEATARILRAYGRSVVRWRIPTERERQQRGRGWQLLQIDALEWGGVLSSLHSFRMLAVERRGLTMARRDIPHSRFSWVTVQRICGAKKRGPFSALALLGCLAGVKSRRSVSNGSRPSGHGGFLAHVLQ